LFCFAASAHLTSNTLLDADATRANARPPPILVPRSSDPRLSAARPLSAAAAAAPLAAAPLPQAAAAAEALNPPLLISTAAPDNVFDGDVVATEAPSARPARNKLLRGSSGAEQQQYISSSSEQASPPGTARRSVTSGRTSMKGVASVLSAAVRESFRVGSSRLSVEGRGSERESNSTARREFSTKRESRKDVSTRRSGADLSTPEGSCEDGEEQPSVNGTSSSAGGAVDGGSSSSKPSVGNNVGRLMRQMTVVSKAAALTK
jgi:hypothetical protein